MSGDECNCISPQLALDERAVHSDCRVKGLGQLSGLGFRVLGQLRSDYVPQIGTPALPPPDTQKSIVLVQLCLGSYNPKP